MYKCLKITFTANLPKEFLQKAIQNNAKKLKIEGVAQLLMDNIVKIIVCGSMDHVDSFLDYLYKEVNAVHPNEFHIEPFLKDRDYRGVFRIVE